MDNQTQNVKILDCDPSGLGLFGLAMVTLVASFKNLVLLRVLPSLYLGQFSWGVLHNYSHVLMIPKDKILSDNLFLAPTHYSGSA